jgi:hypothetical protein
MRRELSAVVTQPAQVDDSLDARLTSGLGEVLSPLPILFLEIGRRLHQVDQVVRCGNALHGPFKRSQIENIPLDDLRSGLHMETQFLRVPGQAPQNNVLCFQQWDQATADVASRSRQQHKGAILFLGNCRLRWRHCF